MCPACGGALRALDERQLRGAGLDAIRIAFEIELGGMSFYKQAAREASDPEMRDLFTRFALMEQQHMETLSLRYHVDPRPPGGFQIDRAAVYARVVHRPDAPDNLFRIAIAFEERAAAFFEQRRALCPHDSPEAALYEELAAEEREHVQILATELKRWRAGKPGLL
jgi:rubrerythrin